MNVVSWKPEGSCEFRRVAGEMDGEWEDSVTLRSNLTRSATLSEL